MKTSNTAIATFIDQKYLPLETKYKIAIAVGILLLPIILCYFILFQPNNNKIAGLTKQQQGLERKLQEVHRKLRDRPKLQRELAETTTVFEEASKLLPKEKEIPKLLTDISSLGRNAGLDFNSFRPQRDIPKDFYDEIPINIDVNGPYHNVGYFFDQISKLDRIVSVSSVRMTSPRREGNDMLLNSNCRLLTYRFTGIKHSKKSKKRKR
jgi:type IV pilus assembly protein PilO